MGWNQPIAIENGVCSRGNTNEMDLMLVILWVSIFGSTEILIIEDIDPRQRKHQ